MSDKLPIRYSVRKKDANAPGGYVYMNDFMDRTYVLKTKEAIEAFKELSKKAPGVELHRLTENELILAGLI